MIAAYRNYQFHLIYQKVHNFCSVDLGGFYLDVLKDRLYTTPPKSHARRSAQTAMYWIAEAMVRWLAPILSFTAEEIWRFMPGERSESVFFNTWAAVAARRGAASVDRLGCGAASAQRASCASSRSCAMQASIGAPLDAEVDLYCAPHLLQTLQTFGEELRFVFITSAARVHRGGAADPRTRRRRRRATRTSRGSSCARAQRRSACAAGTSARMSAATRSIRSCAAAV